MFTLLLVLRVSDLFVLWGFFGGSGQAQIAQPNGFSPSPLPPPPLHEHQYLHRHYPFIDPGNMLRFSLIYSVLITSLGVGAIIIMLIL